MRARAAAVGFVALFALAPGTAAADEAPSFGDATPPSPDAAVALPPDGTPPAPLPALTPTAPAPESVSVPVAPSPDTGGQKRVVYCNSCQRIWLYDSSGVLLRTYLVSGRRGVPRPGNYHVYSRSPVSYSTKGARLVHMVRFAHGRSLGIGFHAIPVGRRGPIQSIGELGQFRSLGCVRQAPADAAFLWDFAPLGTKVVVTA